MTTRPGLRRVAPGGLSHGCEKELERRPRRPAASARTTRDYRAGTGSCRWHLEFQVKSRAESRRLSLDFFQIGRIEFTTAQVETENGVYDHPNSQLPSRAQACLKNLHIDRKEYMYHVLN